MKLIIANWKSNKSPAEAKQWLVAYRDQLQQVDQTRVILAPSFPSLQVVSDFLSDHQLMVETQSAVQDLSPMAAGSYTGAVSGRNLAGLGVKYALVGHSERRRYFGETHQQVANKIAQAIDNHLTPVVCIDTSYLADQVQAIDRELLSQCVVAYEPLAAIGTGQQAEVKDVRSVVIRVKQLFGEVPVLYGGSVESDNVGDYTQVSDGVLVGGASLSAEKFVSLILAA